jgi:hypothetical protein
LSIVIHDEVVLAAFTAENALVLIPRNFVVDLCILRLFISHQAPTGGIRSSARTHLPLLQSPTLGACFLQSRQAVRLAFLLAQSHHADDV